ncbi:Protein of unknown function [Pyronema omphalodes CBS 100304]|uniref:Uncharacterized protein n=1 Tax=Pyronema omphalodes (strain CBS 100304) TaxID=1076935 RepID=U4L2C1_PYROM|nr:Protein of unknown function [Pyronema omphalodes CBS 100304]
MKPSELLRLSVREPLSTPVALGQASVTHLVKPCELEERSEIGCTK